MSDISFSPSSGPSLPVSPPATSDASSGAEAPASTPESAAPAAEAPPSPPADQDRTGGGDAKATVAAPEAERSAPATADKAADGVYTVKSGDSLYKIAAEKLGDGNRWKEIYEANKETVGNNPNLIFAGAALKMPTGAAPGAGSAHADQAAQAGPGGAAGHAVQPQGSGAADPAPRAGAAAGGAPKAPLDGKVPAGFPSCEDVAKKLNVPLKNVQENYPLIAQALKEAGVTDPNAIHHALATVKTEVGSGFKPISEMGGGAKYEGRANLGNTQPGDGERFKGRGYIQLTGRDNYTRYGQKLGLDLVNHPELANDPQNAARIFARYFVDSGAARKAAAGDAIGSRRAVNGGLNGNATYQTALNALNRGTKNA